MSISVVAVLLLSLFNIGYIDLYHFDYLTTLSSNFDDPFEYQEILNMQYSPNNPKFMSADFPNPFFIKCS